MRAFSLFVVLAIFWAAISGQTLLFLVGCGVVCCIGTTAVALRMGSHDEESHWVPFLLRMVTYVPWLMWQIILSNLHVAARVWSPKPVIEPRMFTIPVDLKSPLAIVTYANSITLTPGTVTVDVRENEMLIHALTKETADDLISGSMHEQVKKLEGRS